MGLNEGREIARQLLRVPISEILRHRTEFVEIWLANSAGYLVSWMLSVLCVLANASQHDLLDALRCYPFVIFHSQGRYGDISPIDNT